MATRKRRMAARVSAYLLLGTDAYLREQQREAIIEEHVPVAARDFALGRFSLQRTRLAEILAQAATRPMLGGCQVLVVSDTDRMREEDLEPLERYLAAPAEFSILVFEAEGLDGRTRAAKFLLDHCQVFEVESGDDRRAVQMAQQFARELEMKLDRATAEELVLALGSDLGQLRTELNKLRAYVGTGGQVTSAAVSELVDPARKFAVFDLVAPLAEHRREIALQLVRRLLEKGERPEAIVGMLAWLYRQLLLVHALGAGARRHLRARRENIDILLRHGPRFPREDLRAAFRALLEADVALKSSPPDPRLVLEVLVARLAGGRPAAVK